MIVLSYICAIVPLLLFLAYLQIMDSFSLAKPKRIIALIIAGVACCLLCEGIYHLTGANGSKLLKSIIEELIKGSVVLYLVLSRKVGLLGDATIYGSCVGVGFGMMENILILSAGAEANLWHSIFLGFEAAVMHIGCTSTLAMAMIMASQERFGKSTKAKSLGYAIAFVATVLIHFVHLLAPLPPVILTVMLIAYFLYSKASLFKKNKAFIHDWVDQCIGNEVELLSSIRKGELSGTEAGKYIISLKESFEPEVYFDMICYITEYLELSIAAKSNLILKEAGMKPVIKKENEARVSEMKALHERIGRTARMAIEPIVSIKDVDRWAISALS